MPARRLAPTTATDPGASSRATDAASACCSRASTAAIDSGVGVIANRTCTVPSANRRSARQPASANTLSMRALPGSVSAENVVMPFERATTARCSSRMVPIPRPCWSSWTVNATSASSGAIRS
ncbi:MAG: hypothetical protein KatS3mg009_1642 [Acidimicrobiia bacterium]|nr:MAG: hypothetical protein KatS3mg009_1642 [Acidimicrobiia bacterium]